MVLYFFGFFAGYVCRMFYVWYRTQWNNRHKSRPRYKLPNYLKKQTH